VLLVYWGRRGPIGGFALDLARAARAAGDRPVLSVAREGETFEALEGSGIPLVPIPTFTSAAGSLAGLLRIPGLRRAIASACREHGVTAVVTLMPHLWSPFFVGLWRKLGLRHLAIVHDANPHPGDPTAVLNRWLDREPAGADTVVALSEHVARQVRQAMPGKRVVQLFLPDLMGDSGRTGAVRPDGPVRLLFFGRILPYKGLPLFADALAELRRRGVAFSAAVIGEGDIGSERAVLEAHGVRIVNAWVAEADVPSILTEFDVLVASHVEASQSGVVALAFGNGLPVVTTPIGGLKEQVEHMRTGLIARDVTPAALADALEAVAGDGALLARLREGVRETREDRSFARFASLLFAEAARAPAGGS
jgi:glycosyltransferase involved in cell wall biosynthesis